MSTATATVSTVKGNANLESMMAQLAQLQAMIADATGMKPAATDATATTSVKSKGRGKAKSKASETAKPVDQPAANDATAIVVPTADMDKGTLASMFKERMGYTPPASFNRDEMVKVMKGEMDYSPRSASAKAELTAKYVKVSGGFTPPKSWGCKKIIANMAGGVCKLPGGSKGKQQAIAMYSAAMNGASVGKSWSRDKILANMAKKVLPRVSKPVSAETREKMKAGLARYLAVKNLAKSKGINVKGMKMADLQVAIASCK